jgi:hypothetical protein
MYKTKNMTVEVENQMRNDLLVENTRRYLHNKQIAEQQAGLREQAELEGRQVMEKILEENRQRAVIEENRQRAAARQALENELKTRFMTLPGATESGWLSAKNRLIEDYFVELMRNEQSREQSERQSGLYGRM